MNKPGKIALTMFVTSALLLLGTFALRRALNRSQAGEDKKLMNVLMMSDESLDAENDLCKSGDCSAEYRRAISEEVAKRASKLAECEHKSGMATENCKKALESDRKSTEDALRRGSVIK